MATRAEMDLYAPIKQFLQGLGYEVKGEVRGCDVVGVRGEDLVVVELKTAFNLALVLQGIDRQKVTDSVYLAVEAPRSKASGPRWTDLRSLCRRLGLGLITVNFARQDREPLVEVICDPEPYKPRHMKQHRAKLMQEFRRRTGDRNTGGVNKRAIVTAYREEALRVADYLRQNGPSAPRAVKAATGVAKARAILYDDNYGWFESVAKGVYRLTPKGEQALTTYADVVEQA